MQRLKLPAWKVGDRGFEPRSGIQVSKKHNANFIPCSLVKMQYCGDPPWPRGSDLGPIYWWQYQNHKVNHSFGDRELTLCNYIACHHTFSIKILKIYICQVSLNFIHIIFSQPHILKHRIRNSATCPPPKAWSEMWFPTRIYIQPRLEVVTSRYIHVQWSTTLLWSMLIVSI